MARRIAMMFAAAVGLASCATTLAPGESLEGAASSTLGVAALLPAVVQFDHDCPPERTRVLKKLSDAHAAIVDLDVCGKVRRYRYYGDAGWVDVTASFPPESLPKIDAPSAASPGHG